LDSPLLGGCGRRAAGWRSSSWPAPATSTATGSRRSRPTGPSSGPSTCWPAEGWSSAAGAGSGSTVGHASRFGCRGGAG